jgi:hypothetical protein
MLLGVQALPSISYILQKYVSFVYIVHDSTNTVITYPLEHKNVSVKIFPAFYETRKHVIGFSLVYHWSFLILGQINPI